VGATTESYGPEVRQCVGRGSNPAERGIRCGDSGKADRQVKFADPAIPSNGCLVVPRTKEDGDKQRHKKEI
jgi:hypothetical protein